MLGSTMAWYVLSETVMYDKKVLNFKLLLQEHLSI